MAILRFQWGTQRSVPAESYQGHLRRGANRDCIIQSNRTFDTRASYRASSGTPRAGCSLLGGGRRRPYQTGAPVDLEPITRLKKSVRAGHVVPRMTGLLSKAEVELGPNYPDCRCRRSPAYRWRLGHIHPRGSSKSSGVRMTAPAQDRLPGAAPATMGHRLPGRGQARRRSCG